MKKTKKRVKTLFKTILYNKLLFVILIILNISFTVLSLFSTILYGNLLSLVTNETTTKQILLNNIIFIILFIIALILLAVLLSNFQGRYFSGAIFCTRNKYVQSILCSQYEKIKEEYSGNYLSEITFDIPNIVNTSLDTIINLTTNIVVILGSLYIICKIHYKLLCILIFLSIIVGLLPLLIKKPLDNSIATISKCNQNYIKIIKEVFAAIQIINTMSAEKRCLQFTIDDNKMLLNAQKHNYLLLSLSSGWGILTKDIISIILLGTACSMVHDKQLEIGMVLTVFVLSNRYFNGLISITTKITNYFGHQNVLRRINSRLELAVENTDKIISFTNSIELKNIVYSYKRDLTVLNNINLKILKGKKYLIIGESGCGKSTLLKILCKLNSDYSGIYLIDGENANNYTCKDLTSMITYCGQETFLFNRSIKDNIVFTSKYNKHKLMSIVSKCCLTKFIANYPNGIDGLIDEEVNQISGGEKLRIHLARALYQDKEFLLLDEVTNSLDKKTAKKIEDSLLTMNKTIIFVSHKYNKENLKKYDNIILMQNGRIICQGTYNEIKNDENFLKMENIKY